MEIFIVFVFCYQVYKDEVLVKEIWSIIKKWEIKGKFGFDKSVFIVDFIVFGIFLFFMLIKVGCELFFNFGDLWK